MAGILAVEWVAGRLHQRGQVQGEQDPGWASSSPATRVSACPGSAAKSATCGHCHVGECRRPGRIGGVSTATASYKGHRYPVEIINHCVWLYFRFPLSFREVEELMLVRGVVVSYETIRRWCAKFGQAYANQLRRRRPRPGDKWHLDEVFVKINGITGYLWRGSRPARQRLGRVGAVAAKRQSSQAVLP